jgi:hypothetical protein
MQGVHKCPAHFIQIFVQVPIENEWMNYKNGWPLFQFAFKEEISSEETEKIFHSSGPAEKSISVYFPPFLFCVLFNDASNIETTLRRK